MTKCNGNNCKTPARYSVSYECGPSPSQKLTLCKKHFDSNSVFKKHIKTIKEIKN
jgi:hypothetical protein